MMLSKCRCCNSLDLETFVDLGVNPISNNYQAVPDLEVDRYPLKVLVCMNCEFLQLSEDLDPTIHFHSNYPYFSGYSKTWLSHCQDTAEVLARRFEIKHGKLVVEIASNDGTYIKNFLKYGSDVLGIEPSENVADFAEGAGVSTLVNFFSEKLARDLVTRGIYPDLVLGSNVLAHVPNIRDFLSGVRLLLKNEAVAVFEFPHAAQMIEHAEFDTIYHEHYSYLNVTPILGLSKELGLKIFDVETHNLHGGSLRVFMCPLESERLISDNVSAILAYEKIWQPTSMNIRENFQNSTHNLLKNFRDKLLQYQQERRRVVLFGAAAKGSTLLNVANIDSRLIEMAVDSSLEKQNKYIPGTGIKITSPEKLSVLRPDVIVVLAWNFAEEIIQQSSEIFVPNYSFLIPFPTLREVRIV